VQEAEIVAGDDHDARFGRQSEPRGE